VKSEERREIKEGALFVADSHYPHHGDEFLTLLRKLESGEIVTPQLFLMGDNFDLLFGYNDYIQTFSSEAIVLLQDLSKGLEIHYFEGNHDFLLAEIFPKIKVHPRESQPVIFKLNGQRVGLSHGDRYALGLNYDLYCKLLRNRYFLTILKPFEKWLIDDRIAKLKQKEICHAMDHFEVRAVKIIDSYKDVDLVIEGHYHQAKVIGKYIALPSLACQGQVGIVRDGEVVFESYESLSVSQ